MRRNEPAGSRASFFSISASSIAICRYPPTDLVRREEAHAYPTDFSAMPDEWIERLGLLGEQLTLCLARA